MENLSEVFDAKVTIRSLVYWLPRIKGKLICHDTRNRLFRKTIFGPWLDTLGHENDNHLLNYILQHQVYVASISDACPPIPYKIGDKVLYFGRDEFSLVTGFPCGTLYYKGSSRSPFCARVFPKINQQKRKKVKADDLITVFNDDQPWSQLSDDDAVRVCLLIVAEVVFIGRQLNVVPVHYNQCYKKKIETSLNKKATYNLEGFVWALKDFNPVAAQILIVERSGIVGEDATIDEVPKLVDEVPALVDVVAKDATVEKAELVNEVSIDREVATLKTILGLIDKAGGKFQNVMPIHNVDAEDGTVFNDAKTHVHIDIDAENGKLNYLDPEAYPSAMSQLSKISDLTSLDAVVDCLPV
nr:hypothetical protein [Tanacetum cinerariifolium]